MADDNSDYDLAPEPPRPEKPKPPEPAPAGAGGAAPPPGFVPPEPVIEPPEEDPDEKDAQDNRGAAILAYIFFVLPLLMAPKSPFARYHANQGLLLFCTGLVWFIVMIALQIGGAALDYMPGGMARIAAPLDWVCFCGCMPLLILLGMGIVVLAVAGIIHAANGEKKPLPVVGNFTLIKP